MINIVGGINTVECGAKLMRAIARLCGYCDVTITNGDDKPGTIATTTTTASTITATAATTTTAAAATTNSYANTNTNATTTTSCTWVTYASN